MDITILPSIDQSVDIILYLTIISKTVRIWDRLNIPRKFFRQVLLEELVVGRAASSHHVDGSLDLLHPVVPDVL